MMLTADRLHQILDYDPASGIFRWKLAIGRRAKIGSIAGTQSKLGYWIIAVDRRMYKAHRLAWLYVHGEWPSGFLDHKNGQAGDNRIDNLRLATPSQNKANSKPRSDSLSGLKGVYFDKKRQKWRAQIKCQGINQWLGHFETADAAFAAYADAAFKLFGTFARVA